MLIGDPQDVVTDGDGRLGQTVRHSGGAAVIGARGRCGQSGLRAAPDGFDGWFEGRLAV